MKQKGIHIGLVLKDTPGSIMGVVTVIREFGERMVSILSTYDHAPTGFRNVYLRFTDVSIDHLEGLVSVLKKKARLRYMVDHKENRRILFH